MLKFRSTELPDLITGKLFPPSLWHFLYERAKRNQQRDDATQRAMSGNFHLIFTHNPLKEKLLAMEKDEIEAFFFYVLALDEGRDNANVYAIFPSSSSIVSKEIHVSPFLSLSLLPSFIFPNIKHVLFCCCCNSHPLSFVMLDVLLCENKFENCNLEGLEWRIEERGSKIGFN